MFDVVLCMTLIIPGLRTVPGGAPIDSGNLGAVGTTTEGGRALAGSDVTAGLDPTPDPGLDLGQLISTYTIHIHMCMCIYSRTSLKGHFS